MPTARFGAEAAEARDGRLYVIGGAISDDGMDTVEGYDPVTESWRTSTSMPTGRFGPGVATDNGGRIYAIGGSPASDQACSTVEMAYVLLAVPDSHGEAAPTELPSVPLPIPGEWAGDEQFSHICPTRLDLLQNDYDASATAPLTFNIDVTRYYGATEVKEEEDGWISQTLIDRGTIDREAVLYLQVYDLDPGETLEVSVNDHPLSDVTLLQSAGSDQWGALRVVVPVEYLRFPTDRGTGRDSCHTTGWVPPGVPVPQGNEIEVRVKAMGRKVAIGAADLYLRGVRPIVLVPGYGGRACEYEWNDGDDLETQLHDVYGLLTYRPCQEVAHPAEKPWYCFEMVGDDPDHPSRGTLARNAEPLAWTILETKKRYGVDKVNLLGHSKGGLFMREYVEGDLHGYESVDHLIALDSVQMGAAIMDWALGRVLDGPILAPDRLVIWKGLDWFSFPSWAEATYELREGYVGNFNSYRRDKSEQGVRYHSIIGYAGRPEDPEQFDPDRWRLAMDEGWSEYLQQLFGIKAYAANLVLGETRGPSDPLLTCPSQRIGNIDEGRNDSEVSCTLIAANHNEARNITAAVDAVAMALGLTLRPDYAGGVEVIANPDSDERTRLGGSAGGLALSGVGLLGESDPMQSLSFTGVLTYGQAVSLTVPVDGSHLETYVGWDGDDGLSLELIDPVARQITSTVAAGDPNIDYDELRGEPGFGYAGYVITDTVVGLWTLHVAAPASGTGPDINWDVIVSQRSPISCTLTIGQEEYMEGAIVQLESRPVTDTVTILGALIIGQDEAPDGTLTVISLLDDGAHADGAAGDGFYAGQIVAAQPGTHRVAITATGILPSGIVYMRQSRAAYAVLPASAHFTGAYTGAATDDDEDGLYDSLTVTSTVHLDRTGDYEVVGWLSTPSGQELSSDVATLSGNAGETLDMSLSYDSEQLMERDGDGPFVLSRITLIDRSVDLQTDSGSDVYTTTSYSNLDFSGWEARQAGAIFDEGIDTTGTGGYDVLRVDVPLEVRRSGDYTVTIDLQTGPGTTVGTYPASLVAATAGTYTVTVDYDGALIAATGDDGHYVLTSLVVEGPLGVALSRDMAGETGYYAHTDFQPDITPPTSHILPVAEPVDPAIGVDVSWEGSDPEPGAGLVGFWLQYRVGSGGEWTDWVTYTTLTSLPFGPEEPVALEAGETYYLRVAARDLAGNVEQYPEDGDISFRVPTDNKYPSRGSVTPGSGSSNAGQKVSFVTTCTDPDGWQDIKWLSFAIGQHNRGADGLYAYYNQGNNKVFLTKSDGSGWKQGKVLGSAGTLENQRVILHVEDMSRSGAGNQLTVTWWITFKPIVDGPKYAYMNVTDDGGLRTGWRRLTTWTVDGTNQAPERGSVVPNAAACDAAVPFTFTTTSSDPNGWPQLKFVSLTIGQYTSGADGLKAYYNQDANKFYLVSDAGTGWSAGVSPGGSEVLENSRVILNLPDMSVVGITETMTINWNVTFKEKVAGVKKVYMNPRDDRNVKAGWKKIGYLTVNRTNVAPTADSGTPSSGESDPGEVVQFTTECTDWNGWPQLKFVTFSIGSDQKGLDGLKAYWNQGGGKFFLSNDAGTNWIGPMKPGGAGTLENSRVILNLPDMSVVAMTDTVEINWSVIFKVGVGGDKNIYLNVWDDYNAKSGWQEMGSWTVTGGGGGLGLDADAVPELEPRVMGPDEESGIYDIAVPELEPMEEGPADGELDLPGLEPEDASEEGGAIARSRVGGSCQG